MSTIKKYVLPVLVFCFATVSLVAQPPNKNQPNSDPSNAPRKVGSEPNNVFKRWLDDSGPIITVEEREAFLKLKTNEERENFIDWFWRRRDTNPDTEENEYREAYYERLAYANEHFTSGTPGWKTDRGRIYLKWGKPDSIESRPSGGSYDRPSYEGGGSTTTYPFEVWFYRHLDNVGDGIEIEFVDRTGTGEYRIARNPDEKDALANVPGGHRIDANRSNTYMREQDTPFSRQLLLSNLEKAPPVKSIDLLPGTSGSPVIDNNPLFFDVRVDFFRQSEDRVITVFTVQADNRQLKFDELGGLGTARMNVIGRVTSVAGRRSGIFEDSLTTSATTNELAAMSDRKSVYQKAVALTPGTYKVEVAMRDVSTGNKGNVSIGFQVPRYDEKKLSTSSLILATKLRASNEQDVGNMFVIGSAKVIPNVTGTYKQGQEVGVYMQVYNAGTDQTTLRPSVEVEYILMKDGKEVLRQPEDWSGLSDSGQRLTLARLLPTDRIPTGDYELKIVTKDKVGGQIVENKSKFTIEK